MKKWLDYVWFYSVYLNGKEIFQSDDVCGRYKLMFEVVLIKASSNIEPYENSRKTA